MATIDLRSSIRNTLTVDDPEQVYVDAVLGCVVTATVTRKQPGKTDDVTTRPALRVTEQPMQLPPEWFEPRDYAMVERHHTPAADEPYAETGHRPPPAQGGIGDYIGTIGRR